MICPSLFSKILYKSCINIFFVFTSLLYTDQNQNTKQTLYVLKAANKTDFSFSKNLLKTSKQNNGA